eukprot:TRINITY_DN36549_c0_g1_i1.p1 TRINITY_DN36549_c0_g1~~TRINITY_DN36549_c0_g1_i1.p1  ORF type:complete len:725 (-),score=158.16 TRINITY_DN36549_c0_g1_i1:119-2293(-)
MVSRHGGAAAANIAVTLLTISTLWLPSAVGERPKRSLAVSHAIRAHQHRGETEDAAYRERNKAGGELPATSVGEAATSVGAAKISASTSSQGCAPLKNMGSYFTVPVEVGTPAQNFSVIADTGSEYLIVASCVCQDQGECSPSDRCFTGTNKSSTFMISKQPQGMNLMFGSGAIQVYLATDVARVGGLQGTLDNGVLLMVSSELDFGGSFEGLLGLGLPARPNWTPSEEDYNNYASLVHKPGGNRATRVAQPPVLLEERRVAKMPRKKAAVVSPSGLFHRAKKQQGRRGKRRRKQDPYGGGDGVSEEDLQDALNKLLNPDDAADGSEAAGSSDIPAPTPSPTIPEGQIARFTDMANIEHFSMCFNEEDDGVLQFSQSAAAGASSLLQQGNEATHASSFFRETAVNNIGTFHWAFDFRGIVVGDNAAASASSIASPANSSSALLQGNSSSRSARFCDPSNKTEGMDTACAGIPDSGTTLIMGPGEHVQSLFEDICDNWHRCADNYTKITAAAQAASDAARAAYNGEDPFDIQVPSKMEIFSRLLSDCETWMTHDKGVDELPPIHIRVGDGGSGTGEQTISLSGWHYVLEAEEEEMAYSSEDGEMPTGTGVVKKVCAPAIDAMEYYTQKNGDVWIFGTPLFFGYRVNYGLRAQPAQMSFESLENTECGQCNPVTYPRQIDALLEVRDNESRQGGREKASSQRTKARRLRKLKGKPRRPRLDPRKPL